jgi:diguanylate cyclase (GGDEF)-like protein
VRPALRLLAPEGLLLVAAAALVRWGLAFDGALAFAAAYPYVVLLAGALLSWRFHRARLLVALLVLASTYLALRLIPAPELAPGHPGRLVLVLIGVLLPVNLAALGLLPERELLGRAGLVRLGALTAQVGVVHLLYRAYPAVTEGWLEPRWLPAAGAAWAHLPAAAVMAFALAALALLVRSLWRPEPATRGLFWACIACFLGLRAAVTGADAATQIYLATAGLAVVVAAVESTYALAYRDELTALPSRRALAAALDGIDDTYTIAMVDVDHFKQFNDRYGHDVGDQVLRMVAARLAEVNGGGRAFRYGGEEFTLLFPGRRLDATREALEAVRRAVADAGFAIRGADRPKRKPKTPPRKGGAKKLSVTVSIGAAERNGRHASADDVIRAADRALYKAKENGRNRVETG